MSHSEHHRSEHIGWLRASVLGANDGIVSTASLILGVAAAGAQGNGVVVAGVAGLVEKVGAAMLLRFGFNPALFLMDLPQYKAILAANPYKAQGTADGTKVHIVFLATPAAGADMNGLKAAALDGEQVTLTDAALYLHTPNGFGRSALAEKLPKYIKVTHTARNQRSAESILALAQALPVA